MNPKSGQQNLDRFSKIKQLMLKLDRIEKSRR